MDTSMMTMRRKKRNNNAGNTKAFPTAKRNDDTTKTTPNTNTSTRGGGRRRKKKRDHHHHYYDQQLCIGRRASDDEALMTMEEDVLDELCTRFIINVPECEYESSNRLLFAIEEAYWFYVDFYNNTGDNNGNSGTTNGMGVDFATFADRLFAHYGPLRPYRSVLRPVIRDFYRYKFAIPCFGGIIVNETLDRVLLIKPYGGVQYKFPRGKVAKNETELECAIREVDEEVGFDMTEALLGANATGDGGGDNSGGSGDQQQQQQQHRFIEFRNRGQYTKLFVVTGVSERDTVFRTKTRNEVSEISWHSIQTILATEAEKGRSSQNYYVAVSPIVRKLQETILESMKRKRVVRSSIAPEMDGGSVCADKEAVTVMVEHHNGHHATGTLCSARRVHNERGQSLDVDSTTCIGNPKQQQQEVGRHKLRQPLSSRHGSSGVSPEKKKTKRGNQHSSHSHDRHRTDNNGSISRSTSTRAANRSTTVAGLSAGPSAIRILSRPSANSQEKQKQKQKQSSAFNFSFNRDELLVEVIQ